MIINKFQQGGNIQLLLAQELVANGLPEQTVQQLAQNLELWGLLVEVYKLKGIQGVAEALQQLTLQQAQVARHGAKLQYIKSLKNQCADDEELYYYKKGGSVGCGCKKKEDGGEIKKALNGTVAKFKNRTKAELDKINKLSEDDYFNGIADHTKPGISQKPVLKFKTRSKAELDRINKLSEKDYFAGTADHTKPGVKKVSKKACGSKIKKDCNGAVAKFKAKCGAKMKKHELGGSLNGISFYQDGGKNKKSINNYYLTDYSEPNILQKAKLNGKELTIKVNKGLQKGEDPITIRGNNYYLKGDSTLVKNDSIPYSFLQLRNAGINKKYNGGSLNGIFFKK